MKVILLQDVAKIGRRFSVVDVPSGHARNKLIPQGLAQEATAQNIKTLEAKKAKGAADKAASDQHFTDALKTLEGQTVEVVVEANDNGHLFESLKSKKIQEAVEALGVTLSDQQIHITEPIKEVGEHAVVLKEGEVSGELTITVKAA